MKKTLTMLALGLITLTSFPNISNSLNSSLKNNYSQIKKNLKITNGTDVPEGKYPWYGTVKTTQNDDTATGAGGGVLIAPDLFLTAAHVATNFYSTPEMMKIVFGMYDKNNAKNLEKRLAKKIITISGNWNFENTKDIALVQLDKPITDIKPINIGTETEIPKIGEMVTAMGFGISGIDKSGQAIWPNHMQEANLQVQDPSIARDPKYQVIDFDEKYDFLAGSITGKRINSALGDSGGPLVKKINGEWTVLGIVSHGKYDWVTPLPGVYTSVGAFHDWIINYI